MIDEEGIIKNKLRKKNRQVPRPKKKLLLTDYSQSVKKFELASKRQKAVKVKVKIKK
jgi:hypothetical protein